MGADSEAAGKEQCGTEDAGGSIQHSTTRAFGDSYFEPFYGGGEAQHTTTNTEAEAEVVKAALATPILTVKVETELKTQAVEEGAAVMESPLVLVSPALSSFVLHNEV